MCKVSLKCILYIIIHLTSDCGIKYVTVNQKYTFENLRIKTRIYQNLVFFSLSVEFGLISHKIQILSSQ